MSKNLSAKYCQEIKKILQKKKTRERYGCNNMVANVTKISQKIKKSLLSIEKK